MIVTRTKKVKTESGEEVEVEENAAVAPVDIANLPTEVHFSGDLTPSAAVYRAAASVVCGRCSETPCEMCKRPFHHRAVALQQPFASVMFRTPVLYAALFQSAFTETAYHNLVVGYSAVLVHLQDLLNPDRFWISQTWTDEARERRARAYALWKPFLHEHRSLMGGAFGQTDPAQGRAGVLQAYQRAIAAGLRAARVADEAEFSRGLEEEMKVLCPPLEETGRAMSEVNDFNAKHTEWAGMCAARAS